MSNFSAANYKVLLLNKSWQAIKVISLKKAMKKVTAEYQDGTPKAKIIDCIYDFQSLTWDDWRAMRPNPQYCSKCHVIKETEQIDNDKCKDCGNLVGEKSLRSANDVIRLPRVIQLTRYDKSFNKVKYNRRTIYRRDQNKCQYCGDMPGTKELSLDHVLPRSKGGKSTWENIVVACTPCNSRKADKTLEESGMKLLKQPVKPKYNLDFGDVRIRDWDSFISESYWLCSLENENASET